MDNKFHFLTGDVNYRQYGGKWYRQIDDTIYHVIELINMWDATGEENQSQYNVSLQEIDLMTADIKSAVESCGWINDDNISELLVIDAISGYGQYAPMGNWNGNNYLELLKLAKYESHRLSDDYDYHESQLERPVNLLGSTAREFSNGDFTSAMIRGIAKGNKSARIIGKIHGLNEKDLNEIANDDSMKNFSLYE